MKMRCRHALALLVAASSVGCCLARPPPPPSTGVTSAPPRTNQQQQQQATQPRRRRRPSSSAASTNASTSPASRTRAAAAAAASTRTRRRDPAVSSSVATAESYQQIQPNDEALLDLDELADGSNSQFETEQYAVSSGMAGMFGRGGEDSDDDSDGYDAEYGQGSEKGALYDAYNMLHSLAQDFEKPFDAPAVVVVGHQSSGKSALIEALMGFQFNQVGGGTKTRRPVALRMQYNPRCSTPKCFLQGDDGIERPKTLQEIQEYIEAENDRLERDPVRSFDAREINVRMEYKYCPNMILIDTPGLIAAPKVPRGRNAGQANAQQRALSASAREAERLVVSKMRCPDYIILCVEDSMDWKHGSTREVVQKADPDLSRTVIVNTKLDTKIPQFGSAADLMDYLRAEIVDRISPHKLGGPFFSSVPSGRVGRQGGYDEDGQYLFDNDDDFVAACADSEDNDRGIIAQRLKAIKPETDRNGKPKNNNAALTAARAFLPRVGLGRLRGFLERRVDECYRRNVAKIVPLLQAEHASVERRLQAVETELDALSVERLKAGADAFCDEFCSALKDAIQGSVTAPSHMFGETLEQEVGSVGSFSDISGCPMAVTQRTWDRLLVDEVGNKDHRLYGGSQYHRAIREFNLASRCLRLPTITEDEIANAAGVGDTHDGVNFLRASCVIALEKARVSFDPLLEALRLRMCHVMERLYPVSEYMLRQRNERKAASYAYMKQGPSDDQAGKAFDITQNNEFRQLVRTIFERFIEQCSESTMSRCHDDLTALTRFVTWDLHERSSGALRRSLPDQTDIVSVYQVAVKAAKKGSEPDQQQQPKAPASIKGGGRNNQRQQNAAAPGGGSLVRPSSSVLTPIADKDESHERDYCNLLQLMEEAACSRDANRTNLVVGGLVQHIVAQWRETFGRSITTKYNCFFLLPFVDEFHRYLRTELQKVYDGDGSALAQVFDLTTARRALQQQRQELLNESAANKRLQAKFDEVSHLMRNEQERGQVETQR